MCRAAEQQAAEQPGHQCVAGQDHADTQHIVCQCRRLVLSHGHDPNQGQHYGTEATNPAAQEFDLGSFPAEMQFSHTTRRQNPVGGVEHQPGLSDLQQSGTEVGVLATSVDLQGQAAQGQAQAHRHGQEDVDQNGLGRVPLAVTFEVADILVNLGQPGIKVFAPPEQGANQQQQRQEQQWALGQAIAQLLQARSPWQADDLLLQAFGYAGQPFEIQRLVAWNPEHLLIKRGAQVLGSAEQLLLVQLQGDGFVKQRAQFAVQAFEQVAAGDRHL
ncbi:hypothetical protein D3C77_464730 [compost metagenome]